MAHFVVIYTHIYFILYSEYIINITLTLTLYYTLLYSPIYSFANPGYQGQDYSLVTVGLIAF